MPRTPSVLEYWVESTGKDSEHPSEEAGLSGRSGALVDAISIACLPRVGSGFLLEKISLTAGESVTPALIVAAGVRDKPVRLHP